MEAPAISRTELGEKIQRISKILKGMAALKKKMFSQLSRMYKVFFNRASLPGHYRDYEKFDEEEMDFPPVIEFPIGAIIDALIEAYSELEMCEQSSFNSYEDCRDDEINIIEETNKPATARATTEEAGDYEEEE